MFTSILRSAFFYRRINAIVALAVAISTAVIGGSLIVGDSVRYSLRQMTFQRLGDVTHVVHGRFVREQLATDVAANQSTTAAPAILVTAGMERSREDAIGRVGSVTLLAIDDSGWAFLDSGDTALPNDGSIVLGFRTARELDVQPGDRVSAWVELPSSIPRDSLLGEREDVSAELQFTVSGILAETDGASRFTLNPGQQLPFNAFVSLSGLQERLGLSAVERSFRNPVAKPARVNTLLMRLDDGTVDPAELLRGSLTLDDLSLRLRADDVRGYLSAETDRMILENPLVDAIEAASSEYGLSTAPTLVYLINELAASGASVADKHYSMYSIVAGVPLNLREPLGPFVLQDGSTVTELTDNEILLSDWLCEDLNVDVGDHIAARWHPVGSHGELPEVKTDFQVRGILRADDRLTVDSGLTPQIPGVTDVESFSDWDQPFKMDINRITDRDDDYWTAHRATPKAFVSLETAQKLWTSRFGRATSVRIAADGRPLPLDRLEAVARELTTRIPREADLAALGLVPMAVLEDGLKASAGANDFTQLFAGFSFFLILSAIILASLMFRLGIQQRLSQAGLLQAVGLPENRVRWFFLGEGLLVAVVGATLGAALAVGFAKLMVYGLTTWWIGAIGTKFLQVYILPGRLFVAALISVALAAIVIWQAVRQLQKSSVRDLLTGQTSESPTRLSDARRINLLTALSLLAAILFPAAAIGGLLPNGEAFSGLTWNMVAFFVGGSGCLAGGLLLLRRRLQRQNETASGSMNGLTGFALANAARSPWRSLLTTALIASATFLIVAVAAGRRNPLSETPDRESGNGGFRLIAESSQPILHDLNSSDGRTALAVEEYFDEAGLEDTTTVYSFASRPGEDASCVNLYQTRLPTLLGATPDFIQRGGFRFANTPGKNPWELLRKPIDDAGDLPRYPVIGDMNTLMYSLKKDIGDVIAFPDEQDATAELEIVGMLDGSLFQGVLVLSREHLQELDPDVSGFQYFLAEAGDAEHANTLATVLESRLNAFGMDTEPVGERLAGFLAVQNTYLSTFQLLGGLGLLLGTFGLAAVMMRNVVEREPEIALLRALGFTGSRISWLVLIENCVLLFWGVVLGTMSALLAMLPHLLSTGADLPWWSLGITLAVVSVAGILASTVAIRRAQSVTIRDKLSVET